MHPRLTVTESRLNVRSLRLLVAVFLIVIAATVPVNGQLASGPDHEQLLNGLTIFLWERGGDQNVMLKLRINSGAAFDRAGRDGLMALLADVLFPDPTAFEYVKEQLGGRLEVVTTHD